MQLRKIEYGRQSDPEMQDEKSFHFLQILLLTAANPSKHSRKNIEFYTFLRKQNWREENSNAITNLVKIRTFSDNV